MPVKGLSFDESKGIYFVATGGEADLKVNAGRCRNLRELYFFSASIFQVMFEALPSADIEERTRAKKKVKEIRM